MPLCIVEPLVNDLQTLSVEHREKLHFSLLLGTIEAERETATILSAIHFLKKEEKKEGNFKLSKEELSEIQALKYMLPFNIKIVGFAFYLCEEQPPNFLQTANQWIAENKITQFILTVTQKAIHYYQIAPAAPKKLSAHVIQSPTATIHHLLKFIYTLEFETADSVLNSQEELKKVLYQGIDLYWDKITFNKGEGSRLGEIAQEKKTLDRIIEIRVPCEVKGLNSKTKEGNVFLALDLHMNFFVTESLKEKCLKEISHELNNALKQDIMIKLQRSKFDEKIKRLILPKKIPLTFFNFELNGYLSKDNPSKYEYNLCLKLIAHAQLMASIGHALEARLFLRDVIEYFRALGETTQIERLANILRQLS